MITLRYVLLKVAVLLISSSALTTTFVAAFSERGSEGHTGITAEALGFLTPKIVRQLGVHNISEDHGDTSGFGYRHGQNCQFRNSATYINWRYDLSLQGITNKAKNNAQAIQHWGLLLHGIQDFYSHSAWVASPPIGLGLEQSLFSRRLGRWVVPVPYSILFGDVMIIEGPVPAGFTMQLPTDSDGKPTSAVPQIVRLSDGARFRGLMTSAAAPTDIISQSCPPVGSDCLEQSGANVCIRHGDCDGPLFANCFHHDGSAFGTPGTPAEAAARIINAERKKARAVAQKQTAFEWCRLLNLAKDADPSRWADSQMMALWVAKDELEGQTPHVRGTPCARGAAKTVKMTIDISDVIADGANQINFVLYRGDFSSSSRVLVTSGLGKRGSLSVCVNAGESVVAAVWGWKFNPADPVFESRQFGPLNVVTGGQVLSAVATNTSTVVRDHRALSDGVAGVFSISNIPNGC
jgi:hypothetical protein